MLKSRSGLVAALMSAVGSIAAPMPAPIAPSLRYSKKGQTLNPTGSKLARKAAKGNLTGNKRSHYGRGLANQFQRERQILCNRTAAAHKAQPFV